MRGLPVCTRHLSLHRPPRVQQAPLVLDVPGGSPAPDLQQRGERVSKGRRARNRGPQASTRQAGRPEAASAPRPPAPAGAAASSAPASCRWRSCLAGRGPAAGAQAGSRSELRRMRPAREAAPDPRLAAAPPTRLALLQLVPQRVPLLHAVLDLAQHHVDLCKQEEASAWQTSAADQRSTVGQRAASGGGVRQARRAASIAEAPRPRCCRVWQPGWGAWGRSERQGCKPRRPWLPCSPDCSLRCLLMMRQAARGPGRPASALGAPAQSAAGRAAPGSGLCAGADAADLPDVRLRRALDLEEQAASD